MINVEFKSVIELLAHFKDEQTCIDHLQTMIWNGFVVSPFDKSSKVYKCAGNKFRCKNTGKYFNVRTGTMFDNTKMPLQKWFVAIYLVTAHKKGISSLQLGRDLNITQKSAWFMLQRIRNCFGIDNKGNDIKMGEGGQVVEVDETYIGGKVKNMSKKKRNDMKAGIGEANDNKHAVMGYLVRGGNLKLEAIPTKKDIIPSLLRNVSKEAVVITDSSGVYTYPAKAFANHEIVEHSKGQFVKGIIHTNGIEGAFSMFDRMYIGIYHYISPKHLQKYCDELSFRYNTRHNTECSRFNFALQHAGKRLKYSTLIAN